MRQLKKGAKRSFLEQSLQLVRSVQLIPFELFKLLTVSKDYMEASQNHHIYYLDIKGRTRFEEDGRVSLSIMSVGERNLDDQLNSVDIRYNHVERANQLLKPFHIGINFDLFDGEDFENEAFFDAQVQMLLKTNARVSFVFMSPMNTYQFAFLANQLCDRIRGLYLVHWSIPIQKDLFKTMSLYILETRAILNLAQFKQLMRHSPKKMSFLVEGGSFMTGNLEEQAERFPSLVELNLVFAGSFQRLVGTMQTIRTLCPNLKKLAIDAKLAYNFQAFDLATLASALSVAHWGLLCFMRIYSAMFKLQKFKVELSLNYQRSVPLSNTLMAQLSRIINHPNCSHKVARHSIQICFDFMK